MTITIEVPDDKVQAFSNALFDAVDSADNLKKFSGAMPFSMDEMGVDVYGLSDFIGTVNDLLAKHLPEPTEEEDEDESDESEEA